MIFQIISTLLFCLHYFWLGAYSGCLICIYEVIRDYSYYKTDKDDYIFIGSIFVYCISAYIAYTGVLGLFPYFASLVDGFFLTKERKAVVFGAIITYTLWLIYNLYVLSYSNAIMDIVIVLSNLYIYLFKRDANELITTKKLLDKRR